MKKIFGAMVLVFFLSTQVQAATYRVEKGDTLTRISRVTGHSVLQLQAMNNIQDPNFIRTRQEITYLSLTNLKSAQRYCRLRMMLLSNAVTKNEQEYKILQNYCVYIQNRNIRYKPEAFDGKGIYIKGIDWFEVLYFAQTWDEFYSSD
jgi:hypothetical protein